jgi:hypothetical protein
MGERSAALGRLIHTEMQAVDGAFCATSLTEDEIR